MIHHLFEEMFSLYKGTRMNLEQKILLILKQNCNHFVIISKRETFSKQECDNDWLINELSDREAALSVLGSSIFSNTF